MTPVRIPGLPGGSAMFDVTGRTSGSDSPCAATHRQERAPALRRHAERADEREMLLPLGCVNEQCPKHKPKDEAVRKRTTYRVWKERIERLQSLGANAIVIREAMHMTHRAMSIARAYGTLSNEEYNKQSMSLALVDMCPELLMMDKVTRGAKA